jgi:hypothetical protein
LFSSLSHSIVKENLLYFGEISLRRVFDCKFCVYPAWIAGRLFLIFACYAELKQGSETRRVDAETRPSSPFAFSDLHRSIDRLGSFSPDWDFKSGRPAIVCRQSFPGAGGGSSRGAGGGT